MRMARRFWRFPMVWEPLFWPIASQSLWQHGPSVLWWSISLYYLICAVQAESPSPQNRFLSLSGIATGFAVLCRTVNGIGMAVLCMIILLQYRSRALFFIIPASFLTILLLSYNVYFFDSWKGGDSVLHELHWELDRVEGDSRPLRSGSDFPVN